MIVFLEAINEKIITEEEVNEKVKRVLRLKSKI